MSKFSATFYTCTYIPWPVSVYLARAGLESLQMQTMLTQWLFVIATSCIARVQVHSHSLQQVTMYTFEVLVWNVLYDNVMHTVHSSVCSFCTCVMFTWQCPCTQRWFTECYNFRVQVPAMLGFSSSSFTLTFKHRRHEWHAHCPHVRYCQDKANSTVEDKRWFCMLHDSIECRPGSEYPDSNMTYCQVCFWSCLPCQVLRVSNSVWSTPPCD